MVSTPVNICAPVNLIMILDFRPSLFDDFVEYELDRLKKLELKDQEDDSNNNIKISDEQFNALQAN